MQSRDSDGRMRFVKPEEINALIAGNVRAARARRRLRQEDLADDIGWARPTISDIEAGTRRITVADAIALCRALEIDMRELLAGVDQDVLQVLGIDRRSNPTS